MKKLFLTHKQGMTLIEILISISIFATFMTIVTSSFVGILKIQKHTAAFLELNDNVSTVLNRIVAEVQFGYDVKIRPGPSQGGGPCDDFSDNGSGVSSGCKLFFTNQFGEGTAYGLGQIGSGPSATGAILQQVCDTGGISCSSDQLTSSSIDITDLEFVAVDPSAKVPLIQILLSARSKLYPCLTIKIQTSATPRFSTVSP